MTATPEAAPAAPRRWIPYAVVATIGALFATGAALGADRQPYIWIIPPLVLTTVLLTVLWLSDRRRDQQEAGAAGARLGLREVGAHPLPPLTPLLKGSQPAHLLAGHAEDGAPVRVGHVPAGRGRRLAVAATEIARPERVAADPRGVLGAETTAEERVLAWVRDHPLDLGLIAEGGTLVVGTTIARGEEPPFPALLDAARDARALLA